MHDIKWIRDNPDAFDRGLRRRGLPPQADDLIAIDEERRFALAKFEQMQARRNAASKEIGQAKRLGDERHAEDLMIEVSQLKEALPMLEKTPKELEAILNGRLAQIPNTPLEDVPDGFDETSNLEHHQYHPKCDRSFNYAFKPKQHFELGEALGEMDFETAAKLSGTRFVILKKGLARMERALGQFMLDLHTDTHGYTEIDPPLLVRPQAMFGTAQLPKFRDDQFQTLTDDVRRKEIRTVLETAAKAEEKTPGIYKRLSEFAVDFKTNDPFVAQIYDEQVDHFWLIPTAEVSLTNLVRESIVAEDELPLRFTACTPCFRAEAGAAGRDTRGMIRQHQFTKVELVSITTPEQSRDEHERMLACAEEVLKRLDLHYRVVTLCTGDMGFASQKTYDIEVWLPGQGAYREISSCSVCGDFQARRMGARYRGRDGKVRGLVHTLNGSGTAVGRALVAVMETYQQENGAIAVPEVLQPYMGGKKVIGEAA
jgi:seryl-tRNA synthetase